MAECACGCGQPTKIYKGKPRTFLFNHHLIGKKGPDSGNWKGGRYVNQEGYIMIRCIGHPRGTRVFEHILVMEKHLGRYLSYPLEEVHHINGDRQDNRIENLRLIDSLEHHRIHHKIDMTGRRCSVCNGDTYLEKSGKAQWSVSRITGGFLCKRCNDKERYELKLTTYHKRKTSIDAH